jgi:hypothetical protein
VDKTLKIWERLSAREILVSHNVSANGSKPRRKPPAISFLECEKELKVNRIRELLYLLPSEVIKERSNMVNVSNVVKVSVALLAIAALVATHLNTSKVITLLRRG